MFTFLRTHFHTILLFGIIIFACAVRIPYLSDNPAGFYVDEASMGLDAWNIMHSGRDMYGKWFPVFFESLNDYKDPVMIYSMIPFVFLFGLTETAVRMTSAIYGVGAVILIYYLARKLWGRDAGLFAAVFLAISPWHTHFSRIGFQTIVMVFWGLWSMYWFYRMRERAFWSPLFFVGIFCFVFSYFPAKLMILPIAILYVLLYVKDIGRLFRSKIFLGSLLVFIGITVFCAVPAIRMGKVFNRWHDVTTKETLAFDSIWASYKNHFLPRFLFQKDIPELEDMTSIRHRIEGLELVFPFQIILLLPSIYFLVMRRDRSTLGIFLLLALYPVGSMFTGYKPEATRSGFGMIPWSLLTGLGASLFVGQRTIALRRIAQTVLIVWIGLSSSILVIKLISSPQSTSGYWGFQYGFPEVLTYFQARQSEYDELMITHRFDRSDVLLQFYQHDISCETCRISHNPIEIDTQKKQLFALRQEDIDEARIRYPESIFRVIEKLPLPNGQSEISIGVFESP